MSSETRTCKSCKVRKGLTEFRLDAECTGGRRYTCKKCSPGKGFQAGTRDGALATLWERLRARVKAGQIPWDDAKYRLATKRLELRIKQDGPIRYNGYVYHWSQGDAEIKRRRQVALHPTYAKRERKMREEPVKERRLEWNYVALSKRGFCDLLT